METACLIGWQPAAALAATLPELMLAVRGYQRARGLDPDAPSKVRAMTRSELNTLIEKYG